MGIIAVSGKNFGSVEFMLKYMLKRLVIVLVVLWAVATLVYFTVHVTPGDTATAILYSVGGESAVTEENLERVRSRYDLNRPCMNNIWNGCRTPSGESWGPLINIINRWPIC